MYVTLNKKIIKRFMCGFNIHQRRADPQYIAMFINRIKIKILSCTSYYNYQMFNDFIFMWWMS